MSDPLEGLPPPRPDDDDEAAREYGRQLAMDGLLEKLLSRTSASKTDEVRKVRRPSSKRIASQSRRRVEKGPASYGPILAAAGVLLAVGLWFVLAPGKQRQVSPAVQRPQAEPRDSRDSLEKTRIVQEERVRREERERQLLEQAARAESERRKLQEQLTAIEQKKKELAETEAQAKSQAQAEQEARRQELARLEGLQRAEGERLARAEAQARQAQEEVQRAEAERKLAELAEQRAAEAQAPAEMGRIVFVADVKSEAPDLRPVLVRGKGAQATRTPLAKDMKLQRGDRIETLETKLQPAESRPVYAALELSSGATVDLADATHFEVEDEQSTRLEQGLLYADVSADAANQKAKGQDSKLRFHTAFARVEAAQASFDLRVEAKEACVRVADGTALFANAIGQTKLQKAQRSVARKDAAPGPALASSADPAWRGRKAALALSPTGLPKGISDSLVGFWCFEEETGALARDSSGRGNDGKLGGGPKRVEGKLGKALQLDGVSSWMDVPNLHAAKFPTSGTLAFWIKLELNVKPDAVFLDGWGNRNHMLINSPDAGRTLQIKFIHQNPQGGQNSASFFKWNKEIPLQEWHHLAIVWDTQGKKGEIYLDGALDYSQALEDQAWIPDSQRFLVAGGELEAHGKGLLDELLLSNRPLTREEIQLLFRRR